MANLRANRPSNFGLISGTLGLLLCFTQTYNGHVDAKNERERMQEMHEQKMHYLTEFHRRELHAKETRIFAVEAEKRALEAERIVGAFSAGSVGRSESVQGGGDVQGTQGGNGQNQAVSGAGEIARMEEASEV